MSQLEKLKITIRSPVLGGDIERKLSHTPNMTQVILPNLRWLGLRGANAYAETLLSCIAAPLLEKLDIIFSKKLSFSIPYLLHVVSPTEDLRFSRAKVKFNDRYVAVTVYLDTEAKVDTLSILVFCSHISGQVTSASQILNTLRKLFSAADGLILQSHLWSGPGWHDGAGRMLWRDLLRPFINVKTLRVSSRLVTWLSDALQIDDEGSPIELLPELAELSYSSRPSLDNAFVSFIETRRNAGRPVTLLRGWEVFRREVKQSTEWVGLA